MAFAVRPVMVLVPSFNEGHHLNELMQEKGMAAYDCKLSSKNSTCILPVPVGDDG